MRPQALYPPQDASSMAKRKDCSIVKIKISFQLLESGLIERYPIERHPDEILILLTLVFAVQLLPECFTIIFVSNHFAGLL